MRFVWLIPLTALVLGAGAFLRARRRANDPTLLTSEPVSGEWLAQARGREEQHS
jgi:cytochrome c-type biogenesis protein CcmH/NrfF